MLKGRVLVHDIPRDDALGGARICTVACLPVASNSLLDGVARICAAGRRVACSPGLDDELSASIKRPVSMLSVNFVR